MVQADKCYIIQQDNHKLLLQGSKHESTTLKFKNSKNIKINRSSPFNKKTENYHNIFIHYKA